MNTQRRQGVLMALGAGLSFGVSGPLKAAAPAPLQWRDAALLAYGTTVWLRAAHTDGARAQAGLDAAAAAVMRVDALMSLYRPDSELVRLNRDGVLHAPSAEMMAVLRLAQQVSAHSGGSFDVTVQPLWALWQRCQHEGRQPSHVELQQARSLVCWRDVHISHQRITLGKPGMALTLNGIAQGFAADQARDALRRHGIEHALLDTGEWLPMGQAPDNGVWRLGVAHPRLPSQVIATLLADGRALACSADNKCSFSADLREHHIFDPRSGRSPRALSSVVVAAKSATLADALSKPLMMGSAAQALAQAQRWGVDVLAVDKAGRWVASAGLRLA